MYRLIRYVLDGVNEWDPCALEAHEIGPNIKDIPALTCMSSNSKYIIYWTLPGTWYSVSGHIWEHGIVVISGVVAIFGAWYSGYIWGMV